jgi:argininosuccinate lyase
MKLWENGNTINKKIEKFTVGTDYLLDQKLVKYDCTASVAHAKMLKKIGILNEDECKKIIEVINEIKKLDSKGNFKIKPEDEDCHTSIENYLVKKLGNVGKKIHTGRSRNDQVITALRLFYKDEITKIEKLVKKLNLSLNKFKEKYGFVELPGYTHMQKAMPSSIKLWADAFIESNKDNILMLQNIYDLIDQLPLGTGAGYGVPIKLDRKFLAEILNFKKIQKNPIYVQNSRGKFESSILHLLNQIMFDLNKIASDILLFSMEEFGYFKLSSVICTGSSIIPHKKNPDALEVIRANYNTTVASEFEVKNIISNLISGYNRDLQLTKKPIFFGLSVTKESLEIISIIIENIQVNAERCKKALTEEVYSTHKVMDLVKKGIPFRTAYSQIAQQYK